MSKRRAQCEAGSSLDGKTNRGPWDATENLMRVGNSPMAFRSATTNVFDVIDSAKAICRAQFNEEHVSTALVMEVAHMVLQLVRDGSHEEEKA